MSDNKITQDQLDSSAAEAMSSSVGDVSMLNTENNTIVGALAEIVGKKEIANAIGEPLAETDKFTEMSSEINGLLSTFKTNMMNAGVVVESGDKFKSLIDKIKGLIFSSQGKGDFYAVRNVSFEINEGETIIKAINAVIAIIIILAIIPHAVWNINSSITTVKAMIPASGKPTPLNNCNFTFLADFGIKYPIFYSSLF